MAGEKARDAAEKLQIESDRILSQVAEKEQQIARHKNDAAKEKRELAREAATATNENPSTTFMTESVIEIEQHGKRASSLEDEIAELRNRADKYHNDAQTLISLADAAESAEGQANDAADKALAEI